jgi:hypothetical protein
MKPNPKKKKKISVAKLKAKLQVVFNKFIRLRDSGGGYFVCISCGTKKGTDEMDCGHFFAKSGHDGLRFDEINAHGECSACNRFDDSHLIGYQDNLLNKIGKEEMEALKIRAFEYKKCTLINEYYFNGKWDRSVLEEKIEYYKQQIKEL